MKIFVQLGLLPLFVLAIVAPSRAMRAAEIQDVTVVPRGNNLLVQIRLSADVAPRIVTATGPDRLVLELPNTVSSAKQRLIPVHQDGVKDLRIGLTSAAPLVTRVVLDLDTARPYDLETSGHTIALKVLPPDSPSVKLPSPATPDPPTQIAMMVPPPITPVVSRRVRAGFKVKFIAEDSVYLGAGRSAGLVEGMKLSVRESTKGAGRFLPADEQFPVVAELRIVSVAANSAVTEVSGAKRLLRPGDWAYLSVEDTEALAKNKVAAVNTGTSARASGVEFVPGAVVRAPLPRAESLEVGRVNARIGLDYSGISSHGLTTGTSSQVGLSARADITRIGGTYWNLEGYWRGRITRRSRTDQDTLRDVLNKTYTMQLTYDNPNSNWVAGFGRLYLPWANSLDTIDGGYFGRRVKTGVTAGVFAGSTPDPTSWRYNTDRKIGGAFVNFEGGSYESFHYTSTAGVALSTLKWDLDRPFVFFENGLDYKHSVSVYHSLIFDAPQGATTDGIKPGAGISRSYLTVHYQPYRRVSFDLYHNYFRDVPTASTQLVGTGLVDKLLYQGFSVGARVEPVRHVFLYSTIGHSDRTGDKEGTLNWMQGLTWDEIGRTGLRADFRYSKFDSFFARGNYKVLTLSRHLGDRMTWDAQFGSQSLASSLTANQSSHFVDTSLDMNLGKHSYFQSGYTVVRGVQTNYNQWYMSLGFRIDGRPIK